MSIKIFHTADIHIGLKFTGRDYPSTLKNRLVAEPLETLKRMVEIANSRKCDFFVIAGDMFDRTNIARTDVKKAAEILNNFQGTSVAVLPGNHDFIEEDADSIWSVFRQKMNDHLLLFLEKPEPVKVSVADREVVFYPGACRTKHSSVNMIDWVKGNISANNSILSIGVAHGSVEGVSPDMEQNYFPMKISDFKESGADFWLLGHTHIRYPESNGSMNPLFFMPSTPCPDGFDCFHEGYAWYIEAGEDKSLKYESIRTGYYSFKTLDVEVYSQDDLDKLKTEISRLDAETTLIKLKLRGRLNKNELEYLQEVSRGLKERVLYIEIDHQEVTLNIDKDYIEKSFSVDSLPYRLLAGIDESKNELALQLAYELIEEAKK